VRPAIIHRRRPTTATTATATMSAADAVLVALAEGPASAAEIAPSAGVGRSTATKALAGLAASGKVERSTGGRDGGRRVADRWSLPPAEMTPGQRPNSTGGGSSPARLGKGELARLVLTLLRDHPDEHSPTAVAEALDGRSGAVGNALIRLVEVGEVTQTGQSPRRYQAVRR